MKQYPAIALIEFSEVSSGIFAGDAMLKRAPISMLKAGTVSRGKYLVLVGGSVAAVEEAYAEGCRVSADAVIDSVLLPQVHDQVHDAVLGRRRSVSREAIGIVDAKNISAMIRCSDAAVKGAQIDIVEIRLGDNLGGRAFAIYSGIVEDVEAALEIARESEEDHRSTISTKIIPRLDGDMAKLIEASTAFQHTAALNLKSGEL